jgi:ribosomal protein L24
MNNGDTVNIKTGPNAGMSGVVMGLNGPDRVMVAINFGQHKDYAAQQLDTFWFNRVDLELVTQ